MGGAPDLHVNRSCSRGKTDAACEGGKRTTSARR